MHCDFLNFGLVLSGPFIGAVDPDVPPVGPVNPIFKDGDGERMEDQGAPLEHPLNVRPVVVTGVY